MSSRIRAELITFKEYGSKECSVDLYIVKMGWRHLWQGQSQHQLQNEDNTVLFKMGNSDRIQQMMGNHQWIP
jgi:hypothetical protein